MHYIRNIWKHEPDLVTSAHGISIRRQMAFKPILTNKNEMINVTYWNKWPKFQIKSNWSAVHSISQSSCPCSLPARLLLRDIEHEIWLVGREANKKRRWMTELLLFNSNAHAWTLSLPTVFTTPTQTRHAERKIDQWWELTHTDALITDVLHFVSG